MEIKNKKTGIWEESSDSGDGHAVASSPLEAKNLAIDFVHRTGNTVRVNGMTIMPDNKSSQYKERGGRVWWALAIIVACIVMVFIRF